MNIFHYLRNQLVGLWTAGADGDHWRDLKQELDPHPKYKYTLWVESTVKNLEGILRDIVRNFQRAKDGARPGGRREYERDRMPTQKLENQSGNPRDSAYMRRQVGAYAINSWFGPLPLETPKFNATYKKIKTGLDSRGIADRENIFIYKKKLWNNHMMDPHGQGGKPAVVFHSPQRRLRSDSTWVKKSDVNRDLPVNLRAVNWLRTGKRENEQLKNTKIYKQLLEV